MQNLEVSCAVRHIYIYIYIYIYVIRQLKVKPKLLTVLENGPATILGVPRVGLWQ